MTIDENNPKKRFPFALVPILIVLLLVVVMLGGIQFSLWLLADKEFYNSNVLALAEQARVEGEVKLRIRAPIELDGAGFERIYDLRRNAIFLHPLMAGEYNPSRAVFGSIGNELPWWGTEGRAIWRLTAERKRAQEYAAMGESDASIGILNPYLLLYPSLRYCGEFLPLDEVLAKRDSEKPYSFYTLPLNAKLNPRERTGEASYDVTGFYQSSIWKGRPISEIVCSFSVFGFNAYDLNLNYARLIPDRSTNVGLRDDYPRYPQPIRQGLSVSATCGPKLGCNAVDSFSAPLYNLQIRALPATAVFGLWESKPKPDTPPDLTYTIKLQ